MYIYAIFNKHDIKIYLFQLFQINDIDFLARKNNLNLPLNACKYIAMTDNH